MAELVGRDAGFSRHTSCDTAAVGRRRGIVASKGGRNILRQLLRLEGLLLFHLLAANVATSRHGVQAHHEHQEGGKAENDLHLWLLVGWFGLGLVTVVLS